MAFLEDHRAESAFILSSKLRLLWDHPAYRNRGVRLQVSRGAEEGQGSGPWRRWAAALDFDLTASFNPSRGSSHHGLF